MDRYFCWDPCGETEASIASIKSGIGLSVQKNINLIRENEIEADTYAANPNS